MRLHFKQSLLLCTLSILLLLQGCAKKESTPAPEPSAFSNLCLELFTEWVQSDGLTLHYTLSDPNAYGIGQAETGTTFSLGSASSFSRQESFEAFNQAKNSFSALDFDSLTLQEQVDFRVILHYLDRELAEESFALYDEPLNSSSGIQAQLPILLSEYTFSDVTDVMNYFSLLDSTDEYFASILEYENQKKEAGLFMNPESLSRIIAQCEAFVTNTDTNLLITTFDSRLQAMPGILMPWDKARLQEQNKQLVLEVVLPAYQMLLSGLRNFASALPEETEGTKGICRLPQGQEWYSHLASEASGSDLTVEELFTRTQSEINTAMSALSSLCKEHPALTEDLGTYAFSLQSPKDILDQLREKISLDFPSISNTDCTVRYVEDSLKDYVSPAFYLTSPIDTCRHTIYINENDSFNPSRLYPTLAHEAFPGHLYQDTFFNDQNTCPLRSLLYYPGYTEGWAVYSELLSYEYEESFSKELCTALQKSQEITLGIYALMDMGIHYYGWGENQIAGILQSYFGVNDSQVVNDIYRLILEDPANYLSYYVGYQELCYIQKDWETSMGNDYEARRFHKAILTIGPAPFSLLEEYTPIFYLQDTDD